MTFILVVFHRTRFSADVHATKYTHGLVIMIRVKLQRMSKVNLPENLECWSLGLKVHGFRV